METWFLVAVNKDGSLVSYNKLPEQMPEGTRPATNWDIYQAAKQIVEEFDQQKLVNRIASAVVSSLNPPTPTVSDKVSEALKERGINPESISTEE